MIVIKNIPEFIIAERKTIVENFPNKLVESNKKRKNAGRPENQSKRKERSRKCIFSENQKKKHSLMDT